VAQEHRRQANRAKPHEAHRCAGSRKSKFAWVAP
jgi:hypothetical protein